MANVEKVTIALTPEMVTEVRRVVEAGEYASTSEVMREALREWRQRRAQRAQAVEELRRLVDEGIRSGPSRLSGIDAIKAEARRRFEQGEPGRSR